MLLAIISNTIQAKPLDEDQAFQFTATIDKQSLNLNWQIAPNYYIYQKQLSLLDESNTQIFSADNLPTPTIINDPILGEYAVYSNSLRIKIPWHVANNEGRFILKYQGCAKDGVCYLPITKMITIDGDNISFEDSTLSEFPPKLTANTLASMLEDRHLPLTLIIFFGLGLLLSFTPCVLPMLPIVVNLVVGPKNLSSRKALFLASSYVLGMALCYTIAGVIAGLLGATLQAWLQQPLIIIGMCIFLLVLAMGQFEIIHIKLPHFNTRVHNWSQKQLQGSYIGAFILGILSALIVSPCITPPLIGALTYISQNGNPLVGGLALLCLGLGMGIPLIIVAMLSSIILPKAGDWMNYVKDFAGLALLGLAIWLIARILPTYITLILWGTLCIFAAFLFKSFKPSTNAKTATKICKGLGILLAMVGGAIILNSIYMQFFMPQHKLEQPAIQWQKVDTLADLNQALEQSKQQNKFTLLEFYATWCVSCNRIEATVFTDKDVIKALDNFNLLRVDMSNMSKAQKPLLNALNVYGPPVIIFFNSDGNEITGKRLEGEISPEDMLKVIQGIY